MIKIWFLIKTNLFLSFFPEVLFHKSGWLKVRSSLADCLQSKLSTKKPSKAKKTHLKTRFVFWGGKIQQNVISFILNAFLLSSIKCKMSTHYSELLAKWYFGRIRECVRLRTDRHRRLQTAYKIHNFVFSKIKKKLFPCPVLKSVSESGMDALIKLIKTQSFSNIYQAF